MVHHYFDQGGLQGFVQCAASHLGNQNRSKDQGEQKDNYYLADHLDQYYQSSLIPVHRDQSQLHLL